MIDNSNELVNSAVEGFEIGNYHEGSKNEALEFIKRATEVYNDLTASIEEIQFYKKI